MKQNFKTVLTYGLHLKCYSHYQVLLKLFQTQLTQAGLKDKIMKIMLCLKIIINTDECFHKYACRLTIYETYLNCLLDRNTLIIKVSTTINKPKLTLGSLSHSKKLKMSSKFPLVLLTAPSSSNTCSLFPHLPPT